MTDNTELKRLAEHHLSLGQAYTVAKPSVLLALIAENERLKVDLKSVVRLNNENADLFKTKNDKLKAENERLESEAVYSAAGFDAAREEISKLRAEIAGLKTGYEAYERVNAELKAENEVLLSALKGMTSMYGHCWDLVDGGLLCMQDNVQRFEDAHEAAQKVIADLGQGEQS